MLYGCFSLVSLPDKSKWNAFNNMDMKYAFYKSLSLSSLPDISKFKYSKINLKKDMFAECLNSLNFPFDLTD